MKILQTLTRLYISREQLAASVKFYETQFQVKSSMLLFTFPESGLEAVQVGLLLLFAGPGQGLAAIKVTHVNLLVDSIKEWYNFLNQQGVVFLEVPHYATTGWEMRVQNPDGVVFKHVEPGSGDGSFYQAV